MTTKEILKSIFVTPGANELATTSKADGNLAGFWQGLWHGFTAPLTFFMSLFNKDVGIYETHNNGGWYNFGYILGLSMIFGGGKGGEKWANSLEEQEM